MKFDENQQAARDLIMASDRDGHIVGYAGTGKTTVLADAAQQMEDLTVVAPTNKAAAVLRSKGVPRVSTIHRLTHYVEEDDDGGPIFVPRPRTDRHAKVVVDEASMVGQMLWQDMVEVFGTTPIVMVGDGFQLPPVNDDPVFPSATPNVVLDQVYRQAGGSPVLDYATELRRSSDTHRPPRMDKYFPKVDFAKDDTLTGAVWNGQAVILCRTNLSRIDWISKVRTKLWGNPYDPPQVGERLVAYASSLGKYLNGDTGIITNVEESLFHEGAYEVELDCEGRDHPLEITVTLEEMLDPKQQAKGQKLNQYGHWQDLWTFGSAMTVHKAQGSQWPAVIIEQQFPRSEADKRWTYTAVTRASDAVVLV